MTRLCLIWLLATGCSDQCKDGEARCSGDYVMSCGPPNDFSGTRGFNDRGNKCDDGASCKDFTNAGLRVAACTTSGQPDPRCDGIAVEACFDPHTKLICSFGYSVERDCEGSCVSDAARSFLFCSVEMAPNPICGVSDPVVCDNNSVATCFDHYVVDRIACSNPCVTSTNHVGYCSDGGTCSGGDQAMCDGLDRLHGCIAGRTVAMACNPGSECENFTVLATGAVLAQCVPRQY